MKAFVWHETALAYWRSFFPLDTELGTPARVSSAQKCASKKADVLGCVPETLVVPSEPIDILVFKATSRRNSNTVRCHTWSRTIPASAFYQVGSMMVSSPEFTFLQMASKLCIEQLVALGCELCGFYVLNRNDVGFRSSPDACPTRIAPLTNLESLERFIDATDKAPGALKAKRALKYVVEGSRSPMETMTCLYLSLPVMLGGYGLEKPIMNAAIELDDAARQIAQRRQCWGDLCWPERKLDIEYDGKVHADSTQMQSDAGRTLGIEYMGWRVITVTGPQVRDADRFEVVAQEAARALGVRLRKHALGDLPARRTLRHRLEEWTFGQ